MASKEFVFVVYDKSDDGSIKFIEAYSTNDKAKAAVKALKSDSSSKIEVKKLELKSEPPAPKKGTAATTATKAKPTAVKKAKSPEKVVSEEDDDDEAEEEEEAAPKSKKAAPKKSKDADDAKTTMPEGKPDALKGLKVLFTGTMAKDRKTSEAAAKKYGAKVVSKLTDTDYIILGTRPGTKKVEEIEAHSLETITEDQFFEMLKNGVPVEKRARMAEAEDAEPATKKQKK